VNLRLTERVDVREPGGVLATVLDTEQQGAGE